MAARKLSALPLYEALVVYDYEAVEDTELSVHVNDIVAVREVNDSGWALVVLNDKTGWIPLDYCQKIDDLQSVLPPPSQNDGADQAAEQLDKLNMAMKNHSDAGAAPAPAASPDLDEKLCSACAKPITDRYVVAQQKPYHVECFVCSDCRAALAGQPFLEKENAFFCEDCYYRKFNPPCAYCNDVIKGRYVSALGQSWHPEHFVCAECSQPFKGDKFHRHDDKPYCEEHYNKLFGTFCSKCNKHISGAVYEALGKKFHVECFTCEAGDHQIGNTSTFHVYNDKVYCTAHFDELFLQKCSKCGDLIKAEYVKIGGQHYHPNCWRCPLCEKQLDPANVQQYGNQLVCLDCFNKASAPKPQPAEVPAVKSGEQADVANPARKRQPSYMAPTKSSLIKTPTIANTSPSRTTQRKVDATAAGAGEDGKDATQQRNSSALHRGEGVYFPYSALKKGEQLPPNVDPSHRERYLAPDVFEKLFNMTPAAFSKLKDWKKRQLKESVGLW